MERQYLKSKNRVLWRLVRLSYPYRYSMIIGLLAALFLSGIDALFAYLISPIVNKGFVHPDKQFIIWLPLIILTLFLLRGLFDFLSTYKLSRATKLLLAAIRKSIFAKQLDLPVQHLNQNSNASFLSLLIYNVDQLSNASTTTVLILVKEVTLILGMVFVLFYLSWKLALLLLIIMPLVFLLYRITSKLTRKIGSVSQKYMANVMQIAQESIQNFLVLRVFSAKKYESKRFSEAIDNARRQDLRAVTINSISGGLIQILFAIFLATVLWVSMQPKLGLTAGAFAATIGALVQLLRPMRRLSSINASLQLGIAGAKSVFNFLDLDVEPDAGSYQLERCKGNIEFNNVSFLYANKKIGALENVSFQAMPGTVTALVGLSGAGKTTLINLLPRFFLPSEGAIFLDGRDLNDYKLANLREHIALVSQSAQLFNDTILSNIAYGEHVDEAKLQKAIVAAKSAYIWDFIQELPDGLNTMIGDNGVLLSGGQKQRLAIARAIYKDAPILILDEATSALDSYSEKIIQAALQQLMIGRTTFVIAHRLSTIIDADQVLVLDKGRIIERGTHTSLLASNNQYAQLYHLQFKTNDLGKTTQC